MRKATATIIIITIALLIGAAWYFYTTGPTSQITRTANIPYHEGTTLEVGVGSAGTLYCEGLITEHTTGLVSIELGWKADVIFPSDACAGWVRWTDAWRDDPLSGDYMFIPDPTSEQADGVTVWRDAWCGEEGLEVEWEFKLMIYSDRIHFIGSTDGIVYYDEIRDIIGWEDMLQGEHTIYSAFASDKDVIECSQPYNWGIEIQTPPFKLVRSGDNFWFE